MTSTSPTQTSPTASTDSNQLIPDQMLSPEERYNKRVQEIALQNGWSPHKAKRAMKAVQRKNLKKLKKSIAKSIKSGKMNIQPPAGITEEQVQAAEAVNEETE